MTLITYVKFLRFVLMRMRVIQEWAWLQYEVRRANASLAAMATASTAGRMLGKVVFITGAAQGIGRASALVS